MVMGQTLNPRLQTLNHKLLVYPPRAASSPLLLPSSFQLQTPSLSVPSPLIQYAYIMLQTIANKTRRPCLSKSLPLYAAITSKRPPHLFA